MLTLLLAQLTPASHIPPAAATHRASSPPSPIALASRALTTDACPCNSNPALVRRVLARALLAPGPHPASAASSSPRTCAANPVPCPRPAPSRVARLTLAPVAARLRIADPPPLPILHARHRREPSERAAQRAPAHRSSRDQTAHSRAARCICHRAPRPSRSARDPIPCACGLACRAAQPSLPTRAWRAFSPPGPFRGPRRVLTVGRVAPSPGARPVRPGCRTMSRSPPALRRLGGRPAAGETGFAGAHDAPLPGPWISLPSAGVHLTERAWPRWVRAMSIGVSARLDCRTGGRCHDAAVPSGMDLSVCLCLVGARAATQCGSWAAVGAREERSAELALGREDRLDVGRSVTGPEDTARRHAPGADRRGRSLWMSVWPLPAAEGG
ncbi:hypothetical protein BD413DRAFT_163654 [Trametes elegans]|nr:hypothetical protein BD413DRAFT_163654 [Trametes elegans]